MSNFFASLSIAALASRNGCQRATLSGRNWARAGSSCQPELLGDLDRRAPQHLGVQLVRPGHDLDLGREEELEQLLLVDREAVPLGLGVERVDDPLLPVDQAAVAVCSDPLEVLLDITGNRHGARHYRVGPVSPTRREVWLGGAHLAVLWALAFAQPLFEILSAEPRVLRRAGQRPRRRRGARGRARRRATGADARGRGARAAGAAGAGAGRPPPLRGASGRRPGAPGPRRGDRAAGGRARRPSSLLAGAGGARRLRAHHVRARPCSAS